MHILIIEDEEQLCRSIAEGLRMNRYETDICFDGNEGLQLCMTENYDLILLDLNLPGIDGLEILRQFRNSNSTTPVLILSARGQIQDKVEGLDLGANDYLTKPFHFEELEARIRSLTRRKFIQEDVCLKCERITFDTRTRKASVDDSPLSLTRKESALLEYFLLHRNRIISPEEMIEHLWDGSVNSFSNSIRVHTVTIILLSSIGTYFISRRALSPLRDLNTKIGKIQAQNLSETLEVPDSNDEVSQLTISFNEMLSRLDDAFTAQKQFSASAAHELRTPLAVMQTNLEVFARKKEPSTEEYQEIFSMIQEQTGRLSHLAEVLLDMTGLQTVERSETISLAELTEEVFCDLASIADQKQIELIQKDGDCTVTGSYLLLYRAIYNLVENAIKYNHPSGKVTVTIHPEKSILDVASHPHPTDCAFVEISDTGTGISPEYQKKIFAPFFRVDKSRSRAMGGAGLGLALVAEIARQHSDQVRVLESNEKGSTIALMLPMV